MPPKGPLSPIRQLSAFLQRGPAAPDARCRFRAASVARSWVKWPKWPKWRPISRCKAAQMRDEARRANNHNSYQFPIGSQRNSPYLAANQERRIAGLQCGLCTEAECVCSARTTSHNKRPLVCRRASSARTAPSNPQRTTAPTSVSRAAIPSLAPTQSPIPIPFPTSHFPIFHFPLSAFHFPLSLHSRSPPNGSSTTC